MDRNKTTSKRMPVALPVQTGILGSGETTLVNGLQQHPEIAETAVIVNGFGKIGRFWTDHATR